MWISSIYLHIFQVFSVIIEQVWLITGVDVCGCLVVKWMCVDSGYLMWKWIY